MQYRLKLLYVLDGSTQNTRVLDPMLFKYWPTACGAGPILKQQWVKYSCILGIYHTRAASRKPRRAAPRNESWEKFIFHGAAFFNARRGAASGGAAPLDLLGLADTMEIVTISNLITNLLHGVSSYAKNVSVLHKSWQECPKNNQCFSPANERSSTTSYST